MVSSRNAAGIVVLAGLGLGVAGCVPTGQSVGNAQATADALTVTSGTVVTARPVDLTPKGTGPSALLRNVIETTDAAAPGTAGSATRMEYVLLLKTGKVIAIVQEAAAGGAGVLHPGDRVTIRDSVASSGMSLAARQDDVTVALAGP